MAPEHAPANSAGRWRRARQSLTGWQNELGKCKQSSIPEEPVESVMHIGVEPTSVPKDWRDEPDETPVPEEDVRAWLSSIGGSVGSRAPEYAHLIHTDGGDNLLALRRLEALLHMCHSAFVTAGMLTGGRPHSSRHQRN